MTNSTVVQKSQCSCCGRKVPIKSASCCPKCGKIYHKRCYLRNTGIPKTEGAPCICCVCPELAAAIPGKIKQNKYAHAFLKNGFCVIPLNKKIDGERTTECLARWNAEANHIFGGFMRTYECEVMMDGAGVRSLDGGYSNFRRRCEGRFEMISDAISQNAIPLVDGCQDIQDTLDILLSKRRKQMSSGCFYSLHGSKHQNFHTDGPALSDAVDLHPYAINVFLPLVPVDGKNGTEFIPGTQRVTQARPEKEQTARPAVAVGNAILFDYRVIHRGLGNSTTTPRPCYYVTYSREWYTDKYNFSEQRYKRPLIVDPAFMESRGDRLRRRMENKDA